MGWNDFSLPACGEWYVNEDGTSRQAELALCEPGDWLQLVREPENPHDPMAVAIVTTRGVCIGYLRRDRAVWIGSKIDRGYDVRAIVERVKALMFKPKRRSCPKIAAILTWTKSN
ncbi:HIRAN domain-containing protein [Sphingomonas sp. DT-207]|uniref:HIRAN domain-containing protein n=1 Tax=Sphingomonas sp. DT-207 TaxID=3396167 RepID=UPI003F1AB0ED